MFDRSNNTGAIYVKIDGSVLEENHLLRCWGWLDCALTLSLLVKLPPRKLDPWFILWSFFLLMWLWIYINLPYSSMKYCCYVWAGAPSCNLELLDKSQKWICKSVGPSLAASLECLAHRWNDASLGLFYRYCFGKC